jgi:hypothetical protein
LENLPDEAQQAQLSHSRPASGQVTLKPSQQVVSQGIELGHHLLGFKAFFVAFGNAQSLVVSLEAGFNRPTAQVVKVDLSQQAAQGISQLVPS